MSWWSRVRTAMFGGSPVHEVAGQGRRSTAWQPSNPGAIAALVATGDALRIRSRDLVRRNAWANAAIEAFVANAVGTGIKPQSLIADATQREALHALWRDFVDEADAAGLTDLYGLQALGCRALLEGGECLVRLRPRRPEDGLAVPLQLQVLEPEHLPLTLNREEPNGNVIRAGIEFNRLGRRVAYHLYLSHPQDGSMAPMSRQGGLDTFRVPATEVLHIFRPLRPGQIRGEPWLARALVKLNELDQYDDAELVRKKTAAMFAGFITRDGPEDPLPGDAPPDEHGNAPLGLEPGSLQILEAGESVTFAQPADVGASYDAFLRSQFRAVAAAMGITYEQLTGDLTGVNYSSIRAGLLEFRRRCEMVQHSVLVFQLCRPIWNAFVDAAVLSGAIELPGYRRRKRQYRACKWVPQGWSWVDPEKEFNAMILAIRAGLLSRSEAIASSGYDAETIDREIAADAQRADSLGLVLDTDPRVVARNGVKHAPPPADSAAFDTKPIE